MSNIPRNNLDTAICTHCAWCGTYGECVGTSCPECGYAVTVLSPVKPQFTDDLEKLINRHGMGAESGTPDYVLAHYLANCLKSFNRAIEARVKHVDVT